jgi:hypothetical protein
MITEIVIKTYLSVTYLLNPLPEVTPNSSNFDKAVICSQKEVRALDLKFANISHENLPESQVTEYVNALINCNKENPL